MRRWTGVLLALVLLTSVVSPVVQSDVGRYSPLAVFITYPYGDYVVGSTVEVTVNVFNAGERFDPYNMNLEVRDGQGIDLVRSSEGTYVGNLTIGWDDLSDYLGVYLDASASVPTETVHDTVLLDTVYSRFSVSLVWVQPAEGNLRPETQVVLEAQTTANGTFVDPDEGSLRIGFHRTDIEWPTDPPELEATRIGVGRYRASYTIPDYLTASAVYEVGASANLTVYNEPPPTDEKYTLHTGSWRSYSMDLMDVWAHTREADLERRVVDLHVQDPAGEPVVGAEVRLEYAYRDQWWDRVTLGSFNGSTDANGTVSLEIDLPTLTFDPYYLLVDGNVTRSGMVQTIDQTVVVSRNPFIDWSPPGALSIDLFRESVDHQEGTISVRNVARYEGEALTDTDVHVYVVTEYGVISYTTIDTGSTGEFDLEFELPPMMEYGAFPESLANAHYHAQVNGSWSSDTDTYGLGSLYPLNQSLPLDVPQTMLDVGAAYQGGELRFEFSNPMADGVEELGTAIWGITEPPDVVGGSAEWELWNPWPAYSVGGYVACEWDGERYVGVIPIPEYLPLGTELFVGPTVHRLDTPRGEIAGPYEWVTVEDEHPRPKVTITGPANNTTVTTPVTITGTASGHRDIKRVEFRINYEEWQVANGTDEWRVENVVRNHPGSIMNIGVRSYDGNKYSTIANLFLNVDNPPDLNVLDPVQWYWYEGHLRVEGTTDDDNNNVEKVEVRVDGGDWDPAEFFEVDRALWWSHSINLSSIGYGDHVLEARAFDGRAYSSTVSAYFFTDALPTLTIDFPADGVRFHLPVLFSGTASDDLEVVRVEYRTGDGNWSTADGALQWSFLVDPADFKEGNLTVSVRAFDGENYSDVEEVTIQVDHVEEGGGNGGLWVMVLIIIIVLVVVSVLVLRWRVRPSS
jgi:hypothetical protein